MVEIESYQTFGTIGTLVSKLKLRSIAERSTWTSFRFICSFWTEITGWTGTSVRFVERSDRAFAFRTGIVCSIVL